MATTLGADPTGTNLEAEALLDPSITFSPSPFSDGSLALPRKVFLTGATGFVGAFLLDELLRSTEADVFCLIRGTDPTAARTRLAGHLQGFGLWKDEFLKRIRPIVGDLEQARFGLSEDAFSDLGSQLDVIYHIAGSTNAIFSYARLMATNVSGTEEVLRLASRGSATPVHYLSTLAVLFTDDNMHADRLYESTVPEYDPKVRGGYGQSKWVAERLVLSAQKRGLPASIYRCVRVLGDSRTGVMNEMHDILPLVLKACTRMGTYPTLDVEVTMVPVDYLSRAIFHLSRQTRSHGRAFHLLTPRPIPWQELMATVRSFGYVLDEVPYAEWRQEVRLRASTSEDKHFYMSLLMVLQAPHYLFYPRPPIDTRHTLEGLAGTDIACPPADPSLMTKYIAHWEAVGYFPPPATDHVHRSAS